MKSGRRSFIKTLGAILGGTVVGSKVKLKADDSVRNYTKLFKENALPPTRPFPYGISGLCCSGSYSLTGAYPAQFASGFIHTGKMSEPPAPPVKKRSLADMPVKDIPLEYYDV